MNLSVLTDPNPKNYLNINCHDINCNSLQANNLNFTDITATIINCSDLTSNNITCDSLLSNSVATLDVNINGNYSLPTTSPFNGQIITRSGGNMAWINQFNGFQAQRVGSNVTLTPGAFSRNICNFLLLGTNYHTPSFTYTCPVYGIYEFNYVINWTWTSTVNPANAQLDSSFVFNDSGEIILGYLKNQMFAAAGTSQTFRGINTMTIYRQLQAGSTVQISLANNSSINDMVIEADNTFFSGRLLQEI